MTSYILDWRSAYQANVAICGGKGWNLARLDYYGFTIPNGGVVSTKLYREIIQQQQIGDLISQATKLSIEEVVNQNHTFFHEIESAFLAITLSDDFIQVLNQFLDQQNLTNSSLAIRSSATMEDGEKASFAGIHDSFLNVRSSVDIEKSILKCFASLWSSRAMSYRRKMEISDGDVEAAIVICEMIDAQSSGVAFSCDPSGSERDVILINANFGLGESVVSGVIEPDQYMVHRFHHKVISAFVGSKEKITVLDENDTKLKVSSEKNIVCLTTEKLERLSRLVDRIFNTLGFGDQHQDIEWAFDGSQFVILQSRPITKIQQVTYDAIADKPTYWCNGNFRDAVPMVQGMLGREFCQYRIDNILHSNFQGLGYDVKKGISFARSYNGRFYCNSSMLQWLWFDIVGFEPKLTCVSIGGHQKIIDVVDKYKKGVSRKINRLWRTFKFIRIRDGYIKRSGDIFQNVTSFNETQRKKDLSSLSNEELLNELDYIDSAMDEYDRSFIFLTSASGALLVLVQLLEKYVGKDAYSLANALLVGNSNITSANQGYELIELSKLARRDREAKAFFSNEDFIAGDWNSVLSESSMFKSKFQTYLTKYAHRAVYEMDLSKLRWRENPEYLIQCVKGYFDAKTEREEKTISDSVSTAARDEIKNRIPFYARPFVKKFVKESIQGVALKEESKSHYAKYMEVLRYLLLEIGNRLLLKNVLDSRDDIFHCSRSELISIMKNEWDGETLKMIVGERKAQKQNFEKIEAPDVIIDDQPEQIESSIIDDSNSLKGIGVATGVASGKARLILSPEQGHRLVKGDVLVAPSTEPSWTPLFLNASAIVMETGGYLSHGSIVAREYGIPAVVNIAGVMRVISDGQIVEVNGNKGCVSLNR